MTESTEQTILRLAMPAVKEELDYRLDIAADEPDLAGDYDVGDAFQDTFNRMNGSEREYGKTFVQNMRDIAIAVGMYEEVGDDQLARTYVTHGKKYSFKHRGKKYNPAR